MTSSRGKREEAGNEQGAGRRGQQAERVCMESSLQGEWMHLQVKLKSLPRKGTVTEKWWGTHAEKCLQGKVLRTKTGIAAGGWLGKGSE